jgi:hypothetical protein
MFILPNHPEGRELLNELVQLRQAQIKRHLERNRLTRAGSALEETSRLIRKYNLTQQTKTQASLEQDYRQAIEKQQAQAAANQTPETETDLVLTGQEANEQATTEAYPIIVPPSVESERYVTPNDDLTVLNQAPPSAEPVMGQAVSTEMSIQNPALVAPMPAPIQTQTRSMRPRSAPTQPDIEEIEGGPAQLEQPLPTNPPAVIQPIMTEPTAPIIPQAEELPAEVVLPAPATAPIDAGLINNQGVLNAQDLVAPTEEEIPDSERK